MKSLFRNVCFAALTALCAVVLAACEDDDTKSGDLQLFYPTVVDIGPSMNFVSGTPTYYGPAPSNFSIAGITLDDKAFTSECFSIGADTGMVSISNTDALDPGLRVRPAAAPTASRISSWCGWFPPRPMRSR